MSGRPLPAEKDRHIQLAVWAGYGIGVFAATASAMGAVQGRGSVALLVGGLAVAALSFGAAEWGRVRGGALVCWIVPLLPIVWVSWRTFAQAPGYQPGFLLVGVAVGALTLRWSGFLTLLALTASILAVLAWRAPMADASHFNVLVALAALALVSLFRIRELEALANHTSALTDERAQAQTSAASALARADDAVAQAEEAEARYRLVADNAQDLIALVRADDRLVFLSPSFKRLASGDPDSAAGRPGTDFVTAEDRDTWVAALREARQAGMAQACVRRPLADGETGVFDLLVTRVPNSDYLVTVSRDVTAQRSLAMQLQHSQKMEALGRFAGGIAHDFNNLLSILQACTDLVQESLDPEHDAQRELKDMQLAVERGAQLTRQLLSFSRKEVVLPQRLDVAALLTDLTQMIRRIIGRNIVIECFTETGLSQIFASPLQLEQVLMNLSTNARDAMPDGGRLSITATNATREAPGVEIRVKDSGTGLSESARAHLFEPFFTTKPAGVGTGLGLSTAWGIVNALGGELAVENVPEGGTCFSIFIPAATGARPPSVTGEFALAPPPPTEGRTVLVVDDEPNLLSLMARVLRGEGFTVLTAKSGTEAVEVFGQHPELSVLVTDVMLPDIDGLRLSEQLCAQRPDVSLVLTSGYAPDPTATEALVGKGARFVEKPFMPEALIAAVRAVQRKPRVVPQQASVSAQALKH